MSLGALRSRLDWDQTIVGGTLTLLVSPVLEYYFDQANGISLPFLHYLK